jgi:hypothetical protein
LDPRGEHHGRDHRGDQDQRAEQPVETAAAFLGWKLMMLVLFH